MVALKNPLESFVWGEGGAALTPEQIASRRRVEDALRGKVDTSPVDHWTQGLARVADALVGSVRRGQLDNAQAESNATGAADYAAAVKAFGGGSSAPSSASSMPTTSAAGEVSATSPTAATPTTGETYAPFMDTIKAGGVQNPYALAAIAATGRAESGWSAQNANRTWSDPSESGQPGTAGGIMSWRGPRYQALAATGDLSPQGQAKFFLNEDPNLIASLNSAKSVEEAQQLMNKAWAFAGHDRPGGESARRLGYAKGYLPEFGGGNTEVASLDPSAGMRPAAAAIQAVAPGSGYVDPVVSVQPRAEAPSPTLPAPQTVASPPAVAQVAQQLAQATQTQQQQPMMNNEAILRAMSSPHMSEGQRAVVQMLMQNQMKQQQAQQELRAKQNDPAYRLDIETKRAQLDALRGKPAKTWQKLDDTTLFNPATGETQNVGPTPDAKSGFRFNGKSVEAQALNGLMDAGQLTPDQAQQLGAGKTITGPNGEIIFMTPQGVFGQSSNGALSQMAPQASTPDGVDIFADVPASAKPTGVVQQSQAPQRQGMIPLTQPKVTVDESKAAGFADRMTEQERILSDVSDAPTGWAGTFGNMVSDNDYIPDAFESSLMTGDFQRYDTARRNFINAQMRRESGAVIGKDEFANANKQYFPMPGDDEATLRDKAQARKTVIDAMRRDAGPTYKTRGGSPELDAARDAIARGAPKHAVIKRLRENGINPEGL